MPDLLNEIENNTSAPTAEEAKKLFEKVANLTKEHQKKIEKSEAEIKTLSEFKRAVEEGKYAKDPLDNEEIKKMNKELNSLEDKLKEITLKQNVEKKLNSVEGLADLISAKDCEKLRISKSILNDPYAEKTRDAFTKILRAPTTGREREISKYHDILDEIRNSKVNESESYTKKSLNTTIGTSGGYFVPTYFDLMMLKILYETSPVRQVATTKMVTSPHYKWPIRTTLPIASWGDSEIGEQEETEANRFGTGQIDVKTLKAEPRISLDTLEDTIIDLEGLLHDDLMQAFMLAENKAFIDGNGGVQPRGLLDYEAKSKTGAISPNKPLQLERIERSLEGAKGFKSNIGDSLQDITSRVLSPYKTMGCHWLMNRPTKNVIRQAKDSRGQYLFTTAQGHGSLNGIPQIRDGLHGSILGYPILECDDLPDLKVGETPIIFGHLKSYCIIDKLGMTLIRDDVTKKGWVKYYFRKRLGAGVTLGQGIKLFKVT